MNLRYQTVTTTIAALALAAASQAAGEKIRVAVLGDSISTQQRWPTNLAGHLGGGYEVKSFAVGGLTLIRSNHPRSIARRHEPANARDYRPDVVLMMFGVVEANAAAWKRKDEWTAGYKSLIDMFKGFKPAPKIYLLLPIAASRSAHGNNMKLLHDEIVPAIRQLAEDTGVGCLDTHTPFIGRPDVNQAWDGLHPTDTGNEIIARIVASELTGKDLPLPPPPREPTPEEIAAEEARLAVKADHVVKMNVGDVVELTAERVADPKGDGPDGRGNTPDDTWQFWFGLIFGGHHRLNLPTATMPEAQRKNGIPRKVTGPIASGMPNPDETDGWILGTDWDGRFEGVWGDTKAGHVLAHPYVEKNSHCSVSVTFRVPADGEYDVTGRITDLQVVEARRHKGVKWILEVARERIGGQTPEARAVLGEGGPVGDKAGPDSKDFEISSARLNKGDLLRLVIDPNGWWGTDLTRIDHFRIKRVK